MDTVDVCEKCGVLEWDPEDFMDESVFTCSDCACYTCAYKHVCAGQCYHGE